MKMIPAFKRIPAGKLARWSFCILIFILMLAFISNQWIIRSTRGQLYSDVSKIPFRSVALVLGTSKESRNGYENAFFKYRLQAAADLFKAGKVKHLILSGDNHVAGYDEPTEMRDELLKMGIPDSCMTLDYAGFRTFDSVIRCKKVFGQESVTIVSQEFHNQRAVFIANKNGMDVVAFNARDISRHPVNSLREYFAKFAAVLDIYVLHTQPKFLGNPVTVKW
jgi:SanA protein